MNRDLIMAKKMIEYKPNQNLILKNHYPIYLFTNENLASMLNNIDLNKKSILTVCSSSDQLFNFLLSGSNKIETFDKNKLSKYLFYLKKAAIINLDYDTFIKFFINKSLRNNKLFSKDIYKEIRNSIPKGKIRLFWDELFNNYNNILYKSNLFYNNKTPSKNIIKCNNYLNNEDNYNRLKKILNNYGNLKFQNINIFNEKIKINYKLDFIYLSNILDYLKINNKIEYLKKTKEIILSLSENLKVTGTIGFSYLFCYLDEYWQELKYNIQTLRYEDDFINNECKLISFSGGANIKSNRYKDNDALLLYKKK